MYLRKCAQVDYISIPQACKYTQTLSISSLAVYASHLRYFVIVTPDTTHLDKNTAYAPSRRL